MNHRQVDCFIAVAQCGGFSAAARQLYLSQSTVSQQVISLETELGYALFLRKGHSIELTAAGSYLLQHFLELRDGYETAVATASTIAKGGVAPLRLGYDGPLSSLWLGKALFRIPKEPGSFPFTLRRETMPQISLLLLEDHIDVAITASTELDGSEGVHFHPLATAGPCVYFPRGHKFSRMKSVTLEDLQSETLLSAYGVPMTRFLSATGTLLEAQGIELRTATNCRDGDTAFMAVRAGMGLFVASHLCDAYAEALGIASVDLDANLPSITLGIAWKQDDPRIDQLIAAAEQVIGA
ncbi:LysR family transcriptional regulator [uncultured Adlercreutzia sp.]|uniref:LysR family transcriptional regulator n=1 Tax=uncultured Adlercreutzia sp. TaxID=875803 RepID=UPI0026F3BD24|nr:LysR family transcriptional regulator [uncultured Adlercreutzia sp.]